MPASVSRSQRSTSSVGSASSAFLDKCVLRGHALSAPLCGLHRNFYLDQQYYITVLFPQKNFEQALDVTGMLHSWKASSRLNRISSYVAAWSLMLVTSATSHPLPVQLQACPRTSFLASWFQLTASPGA